MRDDMRTWIYNRVLNLPGIPTRFGDPRRVVSSSAADQPLKPFLLISMGVESRPLGMPAEASLQTIPFTVYVHDVVGSFTNIDEAAKALKDNLPIEGAVVGNMSIFQLWWTDTGDDGYDDHFRTNMRPVRFAMMTRSATG